MSNFHCTEFNAASNYRNHLISLMHLYFFCTIAADLLEYFYWIGTLKLIWQIKFKAFLADNWIQSYNQLTNQPIKAFFVDLNFSFLKVVEYWKIELWEKLISTECRTKFHVMSQHSYQFTRKILTKSFYKSLSYHKFCMFFHIQNPCYMYVILCITQRHFFLTIFSFWPLISNKINFLLNNAFHTYRQKICFTLFFKHRKI